MNSKQLSGKRLPRIKKRIPHIKEWRMFVVIAVIFGSIVVALTHQRLNFSENAQQDPSFVQTQTANNSSWSSLSIITTDNTLQSLIKNWTQANPQQQWAVVVQGIDGNWRSAEIGADIQYETASIYKLLMTYPLLQKVPLHQHSAYFINIGDISRSLEYCMDVMLRISDNPCGEAIGRFVGWGNADKALNAAGYTGTNLNRRPYMVTTAGDTAGFLRDLYIGKLFNPAEREKILSSLSRQQINYALPRGCSECVVMNKTGEWNGNQHDAGIVEYEGGAYVIVVFSKGGSYAQIAELARLVYDYMSSNS